MDSKGNFCWNCGDKLKPHWVFCVKCGTARFKFQPILCNRCNRVIDDETPIFCPYCQNKITKMPSVISEAPTPVELTVSETEDSIKQVLSSLSFNQKATLNIVNSTPFTGIALILIILSGISYALAGYTIDLIFSGDIQPDIYIGNFIFQVSILLTLGVFENTILSILKIKTSNLHFLRLMGNYTPLFIVKDMIIIPLFLYISIFQYGESYFASMILVTATIITIIFMFLHLLVFTRTVTRTGISASLVLVILSIYMAFSFVMGYIIPVFNLFSKFIIT
ncbi:MAG: zinc ribbon domain-containing protein [Candidatus Hodarchaeota archaeon]